ncbi:hypothetical protein [Janthinobacterium sp. HH01]|uniref:hypothetical protein n=1 Tax=Janthinobacterium sp. HH01 TaxID=1198452 RepID=UPI00178C4D9B|nr:hypothetical protein [Janthinobacterium sp. HH01]
MSIHANLRQKLAKTTKNSAFPAGTSLAYIAGNGGSADGQFSIRRPSHYFDNLYILKEIYHGN